jgi:xanthine dehydrogenase YagS FAD-binding subunit
MNAFAYTTALSTESAQQSVADQGAYLAGGNDLLGRLKEYLSSANVLVDIKSLPGLNRIESSTDHWTIGALVTVAQIEDHPALKQTFPGLQAAAAEVGSQQIRNVATVGGNLAQHSRCWYYRHRDTACLKKHGDACYARHGDNRYHSLFSGNTCISPVVSNLAVAFAAFGATAVVQREGQVVRLTMAELYARAWENPLVHHSLQPGDLILQIEVPTARRQSAYLQVSEKHAFDWALVSCAAAATVNGGKLTRPRVVLGCISPVPHEVETANRFLEGKPLDEPTVAQAADLILKEAQPLEHNGYKVPIAHALIRRTLLQLKG